MSYMYGCDTLGGKSGFSTRRIISYVNGDSAESATDGSSNALSEINGKILYFDLRIA
jgi:hypothetical protein